MVVMAWSLPRFRSQGRVGREIPLLNRPRTRNVTTTRRGLWLWDGRFVDACTLRKNHTVRLGAKEHEIEEITPGQRRRWTRVIPISRAPGPSAPIAAKP